MFHLQLFFGEERAKLNIIQQDKRGEELSSSFVLKNSIFFSSIKVAFIC
jgi:hypothetical protein